MKSVYTTLTRVTDKTKIIRVYEKNIGNPVSVGSFFPYVVFVVRSVKGWRWAVERSDVDSPFVDSRPTATDH